MACLPPSIPRVALSVLFLLLAAAGSARAQQSVELGDGVTLSWETGALDSATLAGSAGQVQVLVDGEPVATVARLELATRGSLGDDDFTITSLSAREISDPTGDGRIAGISGRDIPLGSLRAIAEEIKTNDDPAPEDVYRVIGLLSLGELTVSGFEAEDGSASASIGRVSVSDVGGGRIGLIEVEDSAISDTSERVTVNLKALKLTNLSLDPTIFVGIDLKGLSVIGDEINVSVAEAVSRTETGTLADGTRYPTEGTFTITDLTVEPGQFPGSGTTGFFKHLGEPQLRFSLDATSTIEVNGPNFDARSTIAFGAQTGDGIGFTSRWLLPITSWQLFTAAVAKDPLAAKPENALQLMANLSLVEGDATLSGAGIFEAMIALSASDAGVTPEEMRNVIVEEANGALGALPDGGAAFRAAVEAFIRKSGTLGILARPAYPVPVSALMVADDQAAEIWKKLNFSASHKPR